MTTIIFEEQQRFRQLWLWALTVAVLGGLLVTLLLVPKAQVVLLIVLGVDTAIFLSLFFMKMTVQVNAEAVRISFFPIWKKTVPLAEITRWQPRTYRPIWEYGGWGIRYGWKRGWAYNVSGNRGVQLELVNGKRILIGSQRADELARAIKEAKG
jgi:hypothetical protein